jgi:hypothetical protein
MKNVLLKTLTLPVLLTLLVAGCSLDSPDHPSGVEAPPVFSSYVAIGNSLTSGYMDSGLMQAGQATSYPRLIAGQLGLDVNEFSQPWIATPGVGSTATGDPGLVAGVLHFDGASITPLGVTAAAEVPGLLLAASQPTPYHNLGVPGITLGDVFSAISAVESESHSPFLDFINRVTLYGNEERSAFVLDAVGQPTEVTYQTASVGWQAIAKGPSLVTMWAGNNDVLGGATGGNPTTSNMTDPNVFAARYSSTMQLLAGGLTARTGFAPTIVVANIPGVTGAAYFLTEDTFNAALAAQTEGALTSWPGGYEDGSAQLLTFTVLSWVGANIGNPTTPIPSNYTLTAGEVTLVEQYVGGYNQAIAQVAAAINASGAARVAVVDANAIFDSLEATQKTHFMLLLPQVGNDVATAASMTIFSLDGVHPNNHGYGIVANAFIDAINGLLETEVPHVDTSTLTWDPMYGQDPGGKLGDRPMMTPEVAASLTAIWQ